MTGRQAVGHKQREESREILWGLYGVLALLYGVIHLIASRPRMQVRIPFLVIDRVVVSVFVSTRILSYHKCAVFQVSRDAGFLFINSL